LPPSPRENHLRNLTPASGRQDHTTSPSAAYVIRLLTLPRPSHPVPNVRDDREAPLLSGTGWGELVEMICPTAKAKYFLQEVWTTQIMLKWLAKSGFARKRFGGPEGPPARRRREKSIN
jgi:hypothetical protein